MIIRWMKALSAIVAGIVVFAGVTSAENNAGTVIAVKNRAIIERVDARMDAKVKDAILSIDTVGTLDASRVKMLFRDDSVLTLGERSKVVIKEYLYSEGQRGKSVFNLVDGKMRAVVGNTNFEIHTPTAVAAARGTVILTETWTKGGEQCRSARGENDRQGAAQCKNCSTIVSVEGVVEVRNIDENIKNNAVLDPGWMTVVCEGEFPSAPELAPAFVMNGLLNDTDISYAEITIPDIGMVTALDQAGRTADSVPSVEPPVDQLPRRETDLPVIIPPVDQQPETAGGQTTNVNIHITF